MASFRVHKFGGTSVGSSDRLKAVADLIASFPKSHRHVVIVSALSGVTDQLLALIDCAKKGQNWRGDFETLKAKHEKVLADLGISNDFVSRPMAQEFKDAHDLLHAISLAKTASNEQIELISGMGELWSSRMLAAISEGGHWIDARQVLVVSDGELGVLVDWQKSKAQLDQIFPKGTGPVIVTGFIASTESGIPTTLKRNGSDYSATIFANLLDAEDVTIWKEVDGILSANPKLVPAAQVLDEISYEEAAELAYFGAKVLHPSTMAPAIRKKIPITIRNSFDPSKPGTKIHGQAKSKYPVKGFTTIDQVALINVEGTGMLGVPGVASRVFTSLKEAGVSVILISQASSEHSICFAVPADHAEKARVAVQKTFRNEIQEGLIQDIEKIEDCSILAMVGDRMVDQKGVAARLFRDLSRAGVNIRAIAQGSSERNISVVIGRKDVPMALQAAHSGFTLSKQVMPFTLIGPGNIGLTLLKQIHQQLDEIAVRFSVIPKLVAIASSKEMLLSHEGMKLDWDSTSWKGSKGKQPLDLDLLCAHLAAEGQPHPVVIDCTADQGIADRYPSFLAKGFHVVTPNKKAGSGKLKLFKEIQEQAKKKARHFFYEATVGAGLPIMTTLQDLIRTGDRIHKIEGMFSGTLAYVFSQFSENRVFSEVVLDAKAKGFTEPDPRDDLSGKDVARKLVILAREAGMQLEVDQIEVQSLVAPEHESLTADQYLQKLPETDATWKTQAREAAKAQQTLRYVGSLEVKSGKVEASVKLRSLPNDHLLSQAKGTDNVFVFTTDRYRKQPLVIRGPGAGPDVTAAGVFADLIRLMTQTGGGI